MNLGFEIAVKHEVRGHIKKISDFYGGDDKDFLVTYTDLATSVNLEGALNCFRDLARYVDRMKRYGIERDRICTP